MFAACEQLTSQFLTKEIDLDIGQQKWVRAILVRDLPIYYANFPEHPIKIERKIWSVRERGGSEVPLNQAIMKSRNSQDIRKDGNAWTVFKEVIVCNF